MKVLVIDDAPEIVDVITICLRLRWAHARVLSAGTGSRGLEMVDSERPDLVILDVNLPDVDGFHVLERIRRASEVPVVMLTVKARDTDVARGLELGADDYLVKPFSNIELVARLENVIRRSQNKAVE